MSLLEARYSFAAFRRSELRTALAGCMTGVWSVAESGLGVALCVAGVALCAEGFTAWAWTLPPVNIVRSSTGAQKRAHHLNDEWGLSVRAAEACGEVCMSLRSAVSPARRPGVLRYKQDVRCSADA